MKNIRTMAGALVLALALAACGGTATESDAEAQPTGENRPAPSAPPTPSEAVDVPTAVSPPPPAESEPPPGDQVAPLGDTWTYEDGMAVTISEPSAYKRAEYAAGGENSAHHVAFDIVIFNGTDKPFDTSLATMTVLAGNTQADEIYDMDDKVGGPPYVTVLPGDEVAYRAAFGVDVLTPIVVTFQPDWEYAPALFEVR